MSAQRTYEVHPDDADRWVLYQTGDGGFDVIAWFVDREDAEYVREAFERRADGEKRPDCPTDPVSLTYASPVVA
jgi:hypothetical protein